LTVFQNPHESADVAELLGQIEVPSGIDAVHGMPALVVGVDVSISIDLAELITSGQHVGEIPPAVC
jgi:hypothetical protein